ncbi:MAG: hypothetical protein F9K16_02620 [Thermoanaerobaculia bacterium]|nr:MAG: hypothetical protein F9K16_02620 [Thermoanaerobaculia bacterium]MBZ0100747.1 hypothetical protein [Thermoanaerobaculia bacterium]
MISLSPSQQERLLIVKSLLLKAQEQVQDSGRWAEAFILLHLHDALELFLAVVAEHLGLRIARDDGYEKLVEKIDKSKADTGTNLPYVTQLGRLNRARVSFKHAGLAPQRHEVLTWLANVESFLEEVSRTHLNLAISSVSIASFIRHPRLGRLARRAEEALERAAFADAALFSAQAITLALALAKSMRSRVPLGVLEMRLGPQAELAKAIIETSEELDQVVDLLSFGISFFDLRRFRILTPHVDLSDAMTFWASWDRDPQEVTVDEARFCVEFAIRTVDHLEHLGLVAPGSPRDRSRSEPRTVKHEGLMYVYPGRDDEIIREVRPGESLWVVKGSLRDGFVTVLEDSELGYVEESLLAPIEASPARDAQ